MRGSIGLYHKPDGRPEVRVHFPVWHLPDGRELLDVTVHPHPCGTCVGGDHTHVEVNDVRAVSKVLAPEAVELSNEHKAAIDRYLTEKLAVNKLTLALAEYTSQYVEQEHRHS